MNSNRLFELREYYNLTQKELAAACNLQRRTYSSWETNTKIIPLKHLNTLSNFYNVSMDYLSGLSNHKNTNNFKKLKTLNRKKVGSKLKLVRTQNNLTIRELANILNTTPSTISAYENGKTLILTAFAYQVCKTYKVSLDWLCDKTN